MKKITPTTIVFALVASIVIALLALPSRAQTASRIYTFGQFSGGTNNTTATSTNLLTNLTAQTMACSEFDTVGIAITAKASDTCTGTVEFNFAQSFDGSNYETVPSITNVITMAGTTAQTTCFDLSIPNAKTLKLISIVNTNAQWITNIMIRANFKQPKRNAM